MFNKMQRMAEIVKIVSELSSETNIAAGEAVQKARKLIKSIEASNGQLRHALIDRDPCHDFKKVH